MKTLDARELAIGLMLGVIHAPDAVSWADSWVMQLDDLPYWLIEISTSSRVTPHDLLKLLPVDVDDLKVTDNEFLGGMAVRFIDQRDTLDRILPLLYDRFCLCEWTEMTNTRQQVYLIDDEWDWDRSRAVQTAHTFLVPYLSGGRSLLDRIKSEQAAPSNGG
ncbi:MAG: hypothetical protein V4640_15825 [Verrucomicrobiota bacterium]